MSESRGCPTRDPPPSGRLPPPQQGDTATHYVKGVHYRSPHVEEELLTGGATQHPHRGTSGLPLTGLAACLTKPTPDLISAETSFHEAVLAKTRA